MEYDELLKLLKKRRSVRKFKADPVPDEYIDKILEAGRWAPSSANSQPWQYIVVRKEELRKKIFEIANAGVDNTKRIELMRDEDIRFNFVQAGFGGAPVYIIICGDTRLREAFPLMSALSHGGDILESSLANTLLYMMLAVTTLDLGAQWVSVVSSPVAQFSIKKLLGIPKELEIYDMMAVGYPDTVPMPRVMRDRKDLVHYDGYDAARLPSDKQVRDFIVKLRKSMPM